MPRRVSVFLISDNEEDLRKCLRATLAGLGETFGSKIIKDTGVVTVEKNNAVKLEFDVLEEGDVANRRE